MDALNTPALIMSAVLVVHLIGAALITVAAFVIFGAFTVIISAIQVRPLLKRRERHQLAANRESETAG